MTAGLHLKIDVIRNTYSADDAAGGAQVTGSVVYVDVPARIHARMPSHQSLEQGLEVPRVFDMTITGRGLNIFERDEVQVVWPVSDNPYYTERFRVTGMQFSNRRRMYGNTKFTLSRIERSRNDRQT